MEHSNKITGLKLKTFFYECTEFVFKMTPLPLMIFVSFCYLNCVQLKVSAQNITGSIKDIQNVAQNVS